jgi:DNA processing protein
MTIQNPLPTIVSNLEQDEKLYQIALTKVPGIGDVLIKQLISYCGNAKTIFKSNRSKLLKIPGIGEKTADSILNADTLNQAEAEFNLIEKTGAKILFFTDKGYPERLRQIPDSPVLLFYKGSVDLNFERIISIVGTRNSTEYGRQFVYDFVAEVKKINPLIVSGLAYGIDIHVHKACLENAIPTIGVMGTGINLIYPAVHKNTAIQMIANGGLLTELAFDAKPDRQNFPARNRIVAGMADATIIVEAAKGGGALITVEIANSYNKDVFAVPGNVNNKYSEGCNNLIKDHKAQLITSATDFIQNMNWDNLSTPSRPKNVPLPQLTDEELRIYNLLKETKELIIDDISWKTQLPINKVASLLLNMEFSGLIKALPGKKFKLK